MWSDVGKKAEPRWLWHAIDHHSGHVLAYVFGRRQDSAEGAPQNSRAVMPVRWANISWDSCHLNDLSGVTTTPTEPLSLPKTSMWPSGLKARARTEPRLTHAEFCKGVSVTRPSASIARRRSSRATHAHHRRQRRAVAGILPRRHSISPWIRQPPTTPSLRDCSRQTVLHSS